MSSSCAWQFIEEYNDDSSFSLGLQTVGEEYCHLLQVDGSELKSPDAKVMQKSKLVQMEVYSPEK